MKFQFSLFVLVPFVCLAVAISADIAFNNDVDVSREWNQTDDGPISRHIDVKCSGSIFCGLDWKVMDFWAHVSMVKDEWKYRDHDEVVCAEQRNFFFGSLCLFAEGINKDQIITGADIKKAASRIQDDCGVCGNVKLKGFASKDPQVTINYRMKQCGWPRSDMLCRPPRDLNGHVPTLEEQMKVKAAEEKKKKDLLKMYEHRKEIEKSIEGKQMKNGREKFRSVSPLVGDNV